MPWSFWIYLAAWVVFAGCTLAYGLGSPWWRSATGRAQFSLYASLTAVLSLVLSSLLLPLPPDVLDVLRVLALGSVAVVGAVHFVNIFRLQRRHRRRCTDL